MNINSETNKIVLTMYNMNSILFNTNMMDIIFPTAAITTSSNTFYDQHCDEESEEDEVDTTTTTIVFGQNEFDAIVNNVYDTYAKVPFETDGEWEIIMNDNALPPDAEPTSYVDEDEYSDNDDCYVT